MTSWTERLAEHGWTDADIEGGWKATGDEIQPVRYIDDRERWESLRIKISNMLPEGARVELSGTEATISHRSGNRVVFVLADGSDGLEMSSLEMDSRDMREILESLEIHL